MASRRVLGALLLSTVPATGLALLPPAQGQSEPKLPPSREASMDSHRSVVVPFLEKHCNACHEGKSAKGDLDLAKLDPDMKSSTSAARWVVVLDKIVMGEMPPEKKPRPDAAAIQAVSSWIHAEMKRSGKHLARREAYANGNLVPHNLLFDPKQSAPFDVAARIRRFSPEIYAGFVGDFGKNVRGIGQPFSPEGKSTFKDMGAPKLDEPVTALLIRNALAIVDAQTAHKVENGVIKAIGNTPKEFLALLDDQKELTEDQAAAAIKVQFGRVLKRQPSADEVTRFTALLHKNVKDAGRAVGVRYTLAAVFLLPEAIFRYEVGTGEADKDGRVRLAPREIAFALAFALTDRPPDAWLLTEADEGKLDTPPGVAAAVRKLLDDPKQARPRVLRFFREYFGYEQARDIFKNDKDNPEHDARALIEDTDRLIEYILESDKDVLRELLTTNKSFVAHKGGAALKKQRAEALAKFEEQAKKEPEKFKGKKPPKVGRSLYEAYNLTDFPDQQPAELPAEQRAGILTQPAWLVAWSQSTDNHAIHRGKWVRERLLGGVVPDIPITVDAQLPIAPEKTLRERMAVTQQEYCWKCHQLMNPVGLPFEAYDHFGRFRTKELDKDVDATGRIDLTGNPKMEADVKDAVDMIRKVAASEHVEQVFVRHAFRYWMGRNESLGDAPSLQSVYRAYKESGGSMKALVVALLTSDSFLYRVPADKK